MRFVLPFSAFFAMLSFSAFMKTAGWKWISDVFPAFSGYVSVSDRAVSILAAVTGLWFVNVVALAVLDKTFSKVLKSSPLAKKLLPLLKYAATILTWGFGAFFILSLAGINVSALLTGAGIGGLVFALASKELASNLFGSLSLIFGHFFKIQDRIRIKGFEGTVEEITLSYTRLTDKNGQTVFMPNKYLTAEPLENLSESAFKSADLVVMLPSDADVSGFTEAVSKLGKGDVETKVKVGVSEMNATETRVSVRLEAPLESFDRSRSALLANVAKYLRK